MGCIMLTSMISYRHKTSLRHLSSVQVVDDNHHLRESNCLEFGHTMESYSVSVRAGPTRSALEIQAQVFHGHSYPNEQLVISREPTCNIWFNHMCDNNVVTAVFLQDPGLKASERIQMRSPFICVR